MAKGWGMHGRGACVVEGGHTWWGGGICGRRDGHCNRPYASYWNAFLFIMLFQYERVYR